VSTVTQATTLNVSSARVNARPRVSCMPANARTWMCGQVRARSRMAQRAGPAGTPRNQDGGASVLKKNCRCSRWNRNGICRCEWWGFQRRPNACLIGSDRTLREYRDQ